MKYDNALFIGGAADGERRSVVSGMPSIEVQVLPRVPARMSDSNADSSETVAFRTERYSRQRLRGESADFVVYVAEGVDAIGALIDGYRKPK